VTVRFGVSLRDVEEMVAARGVLLSYETVRRWCEKFGRQFAAGVREPDGSKVIPFGLDQDVENNPVLIDSSPEI